MHCQSLSPLLPMIRQTLDQQHHQTSVWVGQVDSMWVADTVHHSLMSNNTPTTFSEACSTPLASSQILYDDVLAHTLDVFRGKFDYFRTNISAMEELFEASFSTVADSGRPLSKCGKCQHYMKFIASRPQRLYCNHCEVTYSLPLLGNIKLYKVCT